MTVAETWPFPALIAVAVLPLTAPPFPELPGPPSRPAVPPVPPVTVAEALTGAADRIEGLARMLAGKG